MTQYCCSCRSPVEREDSVWFKIKVIALYNALGTHRRSNSWKGSKRLCHECYDLFTEEFIHRCEQDTEVPPLPSEEDKSSPCDDCGKHLFKNDAHVRLEFYGVDGEIEIRHPDVVVRVCYTCFEREFSRFTIDTVEPMKKIPVFSRRQSREYNGLVTQNGLIKSIIGKIRGR